MKIRKTYEEVVSFGANTFCSARIGLSLETDIDKPTSAQIKEASNHMLTVIQHIIAEDVRKLKETRGITQGVA